MNSILAGIFALFFIISDYSNHVDASSYTHYRLPASIQPDHYLLKIITYFDNPTNLTFEGEVLISFHVLEDINNITLHAQNLTIDKSRLQHRAYNDEVIPLCLEAIDTLPEHNYYIIRLCQTLLEGQIYKVNLHFSGTLNINFYGYYRSSYRDENTNETRWLSVTKFEPTYARLAFPCLDEPSYKAKFTIWLGHHKSLTGISNMPLEKQIPLDGYEDFVWSIFEESVPMPTYLVAYTVNDFIYKETKVEGSDVVFRTWSRRDHIDQCEYAAEMGPKVLKYYEDIFGKFPLKKIDQIAIPDFTKGGMENWGLITYRESRLYYAPNTTSNLNKLASARTISHELAHQWFGNLVTMKWWTDLWLNEGFATYISGLGVQHLHPEFEAYTTDSFNVLVSIFERDAKINSHPLSQPILSTADIRGIFDTISYRKGSSVLRMLHMLLGNEEFFEAIRDYLENHKYGNAEQDDLWNAFTRTAHKYERLDSRYDLKTIMDSWTLQTGFPLVKVIRNYETGSIEITQQRFLENSTMAAEDTPDKCWWVPLSYTTGSEMDFTTISPKTWLECDQSGQSIPLKLDNVTEVNDWIILNIQLSGIYRTMYDPRSWRLIGETLKSDKMEQIHVLNRGQIINDVLALAWGGYHSYEAVFDILEYLSKEREYLPWGLAFRGLSDIHDMLQPFPKTYAYFKAFVRQIIEPLYHYMGGLSDNISASTAPFQIRLKYRLAQWACRVDLKDCVHKAQNYFQQWKSMKNPIKENPIPEDFRETVYCTVIRHGDKNDWAFMWQVYEESSNHMLLEALKCCRNQTLINDHLDMIFDTTKNISEIVVINAFSYIAFSGMGAHLAREYFITHAGRLCKDFDESQLLLALVARIYYREELIKLNNVPESNKECDLKLKKFPSIILEDINFNIHWIERSLLDIKSQLKKRLSSMGVLGEIVDDQM